MTRIYNLRKDTFHPKDYIFRSPRPILEVMLPAIVDRRASFTEILDQGDLGSCVANAVGAELRCQMLPKKQYLLSRLKLYFDARKREGNLGSDTGCMIRTALRVCQESGYAKEKFWPYIIAKFTKNPAIKAGLDAEKNKINSYQRIECNDLYSIKCAIFEGHNIVAGISVFESFDSLTTAQTGVICMPKSTEKELGGHAVLIVGYNDNTQEFIVLNSWSERWGQNGFFTIPYQYIQSFNSDLWILTR
jgi:C1A family cysteine protease